LAGAWWLAALAAAVLAGLLLWWRMSRLHTQALADLHSAEEQLRVAFDGAPIGMALLDPRGRWLQVNDALCDLTGYREHELLDTTPEELTHPDDRASDRTRLADLLAGRLASYRHEKRFLRADGGEAWVLATGSAVMDANGSPRYLIVQYEDITNRRRAEQMLNFRALHDPLTGMPNRVLLVDRLGHALAVADRTGQQLGLLFLDLDRFKVVNDTHGHEAGEQVLVEVARRLRELLPADSTAARVGGDEFVVLCEGVTHEEAVLALAHRILDEIRRPMQLADAPLSVTASMGVVLAGGPEDRAESLLRDAHTALYRAKERGRDRIEVFDEAMRRQTVQRLRLESALKLALEEHQITVAYQPTIDLRTGVLEGVEALARWQHPNLGKVGAEAFMTIAEDSGLIVPIGMWVLNEACRQAAAWRDSGRFLTVGVNLSARQLNRPGLANLVETMMGEHALTPDMLRLEITESVLVEAGAATVTELHHLKDLGVSLGIDDFGTGYSSMSYLKRFPVDFIKVDRTFVAGLGRDREDTAIVQATLALGHALDLEVIAEGIETPDQARRLVAMGCDLAQGYLYGKPQPAETAVSRAVQPVA
jgi:diguanylate cyclase (GGDEF)-like protein/PAS domain S-box-containing protein